MMRKLLFSFLVGTIGLSIFYVNADAKTVDPEIQANIAFKSSNPKELNNFVYNTVMPNSKDYQGYLTPNEFSQNFGQSQELMSKVKKYFKKYNLKVQVYSGNLAVKIQGKSSRISKAFHAKNVRGK